MTMKMGMVRTEMKRPADDRLALQWGKCKRPRFSKAGAVQFAQRSDTGCLPYRGSTQQLSHIQLKSAAQEVSTKGETENRLSLHFLVILFSSSYKVYFAYITSVTCWNASEKPGNDGFLGVNDIDKNRASPSRNGHSRRRTELENLNDTHMMKDLKLAVSRWPKLLISLSHKEKEDDFMIMKGARLPQRPRKRAKHVEKFVMCISPGAWLCEVSLDRYEVREKKCLRRKPAGLKAMESMDMDSDSG